MNNKYLTVTAITRYIKNKLEHDIQLQSLILKGEISNFKAHRSGHFYFTLKDENSRINAVMFSNYAKKLNFTPSDGQQVIVKGAITLFEGSGNYQINIVSMEQDGLGNLFVEFEKLKIKLEKEGLFDKKYKKEITRFPTKIGVLSSYPSAALMDILRTIKLRFPVAQVYVFPIPVQGKDAYFKIIETLKKVDSLKLNTLIISRGGGSIEDLWNFNEEELARTIFNLKTPIISGVGHEIDFTICDFVSDYRAATPTAAAIKATPDINELSNNINIYYNSLINSMSKMIKSNKLQVASLKNSYFFKNPSRLYLDKLNKLNVLDDQLIMNFKNKNIKKINSYKQINQTLVHQANIFILNQKNIINNYKIFIEKKINEKTKYKDNQLKYLINSLNNLSPLNVLARGYTLTTKQDIIVKSIDEIKKDDYLDIQFVDGKIKVKVEDRYNG